MERYWHVGARQPWRAAEVFPRAPGPFMRADRENPLGREVVIGQWWLVRWFAKTPKLTYSTNKRPLRGDHQQGVVQEFVDIWQALHHPGRVVRRAELGVGQERLVALSPRRWRAPWGLAGLWNTWTDKTDRRSRRDLHDE